MSILDEYSLEFPTHRNAAEIFKGEWSSSVPGLDNTGHATLFDDHRVRLFADQLTGGFKGKNILELGPLEGGHTFMMSRMGAEKVTAIEANQRAYLKCLITKEALKMANTELLLGDFDKFLSAPSDQRYDFVLASGVIYHCLNPAKTLQDITRYSDSIGIWSHYFEPEVCQEVYGDRFDYTGEKTQIAGVEVTYHQLDYKDALKWDGFCGGSSPFTNWMPKGDWEKLFDSLGYDFNVLAGSENHQNGPEFTAIAVKR